MYNIRPTPKRKNVVKNTRLKEMLAKNAQNSVKFFTKIVLTILFILHFNNAHSQNISVGFDMCFYQRLYNYFPMFSVGLGTKKLNFKYTCGKGLKNFMYSTNSIFLHNIQLNYKFLNYKKYNLSSGVSFNYATQSVEQQHHYLIPEVLLKNTYGNMFKVHVYFGLGIYREIFREMSPNSIFNTSYRLGIALSYDL